MAAQTMEIDDALTSLALAQPGTARQLDDVLKWANPLTTSCGLVVAIVTDQDESTVRKMAALRQSDGTGLMILLETASFAHATQPAGPGDLSQAIQATQATLAMADLVTASGWSTCVVSSGMSVAQAWSIMSARSAVRVGGWR